MAKFDMITWADERYRRQAYEINNQYFTVDTAPPNEVYDWVNHNRMIVTYALHNDQVQGFFNLMPLTSEAGALFEKNQIQEDDITIDHILPPEFMYRAEYFYFPAIAVRNYNTYHAHQCAAALFAALATHIKAIYDPAMVKRIYANPTTYRGNVIVRKLGLKPLVSHKKPLKGNDIYYADIDETFFEKMNYFEDHYGRFIGENCWKSQNYLPKFEEYKKKKGIK